MEKNYNKLKKKCLEFIQQHLRAPPWSLVKQWGKQLDLSLPTIKQISENLSLRHQLGMSSMGAVKSIYLY